MPHNISIKRIHNNKPICVGIGLVALDVILNGSPSTLPKVFAGGSCGNVLSILSYLGWNSYPIARLTNNLAAQELIKDLKKWDVKTDLISQKTDGSTPIIIHRILKDKFGKPKHKFEFKIPGTSEWLPSFKAIVNNETESIINTVPRTKVFYFDRVSRSAIELAKKYKEAGALIFFEPSSIGDEKLFNESLQVADILKFSSDRITSYSKIYPNRICSLEIETLGVHGLRYRSAKTKGASGSQWKTIPAPIIASIKDGAGAGDWCAAGIIHYLGQKGLKGFQQASLKSIESGLMLGQFLGGLNCKFDGARGTMYNISFRDLNQGLHMLSSSQEPNLKVHPTQISTPKDFSFEKLIKRL